MEIGTIPTSLNDLWKVGMCLCGHPEALEALPLAAVRGAPRDDRSQKMLLNRLIYKFGKDPNPLLFEF